MLNYGRSPWASGFDPLLHYIPPRKSILLLTTNQSVRHNLSDANRKQNVVVVIDTHTVFSQLLCHLSEHVAVEFGILLVVLLDLLLQGLVHQLHIPEPAEYRQEELQGFHRRQSLQVFKLQTLVLYLLSGSISRAFLISISARSRSTSSM